LIELLFYFVIGVALMRLKLLTDFHSLAQFVFYVSLPAAILSHVPKPGFSMDIGSMVLLVAIPIFAVGFTIWVYHKSGFFSRNTYQAIMLASLFGNIVYLGIPISQEYLPNTISEMAFLIIITNLLIFVFVLPLIGKLVENPRF